MQKCRLASQVFSQADNAKRSKPHHRHVPFYKLHHDVFGIIFHYCTIKDISLAVQANKQILHIAKNVIPGYFLLDKTQSAQTNFETACENGCLEIVEFLAGRNVSLLVGFDWACRAGHLSIVKYLFANGIEAADFINWGFSCACNNHHFEIVKLLVKKDSGYLDWCFLHACWFGDFRIIQYLCEMGANVQCGDNSALIKVCERGELEIVKYLAEKGANIHTERVMWTACYYEHSDIVNYLLENGVKKADMVSNKALY